MGNGSQSSSDSVIILPGTPGAAVREAAVLARKWRGAVRDAARTQDVSQMLSLVLEMLQASKGECQFSSTPLAAHAAHCVHHRAVGSESPGGNHHQAVWQLEYAAVRACCASPCAHASRGSDASPPASIAHPRPMAAGGGGGGSPWEGGVLRGCAGWSLPPGALPPPPALAKAASLLALVRASLCSISSTQVCTTRNKDGSYPGQGGGAA
jgi:hypothetical protein